MKFLTGLTIQLAIGVVGLGAFSSAHAGVVELSTGFSYSRSNYAAGSYTWNRRIGGSVAYHFSATSGIEWAFQMIVDRTVIANGTLQDTTFNDRVYSLNWVQSFLPRESVFQPYVKIGIGQLNRDAEGTYSGGVSPPARLDALTGVVGMGFRLYLTKTFAIRGEATTYLQGAELRTWQDNLGFTLGTSFYL
ncbi:MAG: outer membrane beta-barrel protein [Bdellovibrionales bacterium]|nr:outer membrane beta-barrel protein [Bdellovibrionales bacterium]